ncbi:hypothetical protein IFM89_016150 [Coptis chinensis]|uniref:Chloroplast lumen common family protein n=1 Tax=Coptis chinensis TaxID=261450 RepID=A0A835HF14_9MAGN|nr:hypothetical protein IFM89_016150 [Coptis chinensis]
MESMARISQKNPLINLTTQNTLPLFPKPISFTFKPFTKPLKLTSTYHHPQIPKNPFSSFLKTTCITLVTSTLFITQFNNKPSLAVQTQPPLVETTKEESVDTDEDKERVFQEYLDTHPDDLKALKGLMEVKIKTRKFEEAIAVIDRLIGIQPFEKEWVLLKAHVYSYSGDIEMAKFAFEQLLGEDPLFVEAYHGLVMVTSLLGEGELEDVMKKIESAINKCKKEKKKDDLRDFKLLVAQVRVVEGKYTDALKVYEELVKDEPRDFRPYLCQGIIYTLLKRTDEAEKQFQKYRRLVPKGHPYARYFEDNMIATKIFSQMAENQRTGSMS